MLFNCFTIRVFATTKKVSNVIVVLHCAKFENLNKLAKSPTWNFQLYLLNCSFCSSVNQTIHNPCSNVAEICSPCYNCYYVQPQTFSCTLDCDYNLRQACVLLDNTGDVWRTACKCQDGYLPVASSCVDQTRLRIVMHIYKGYDVFRMH